MDILGFALKFEKDGEAFYRAQAARLTDTNLRAILLFLAAEERTHYGMIKDLKTSGSRPASIFISDVQNVFNRMAAARTMFAEEKQTISEIVTRALAIEDESIKYYARQKDVVQDLKAKQVLRILERQEQIHYSLLSSLIEYYDSPALWLEQAEFNHHTDY